MRFGVLPMRSLGLLIAVALVALALLSPFDGATLVAAKGAPVSIAGSGAGTLYWNWSVTAATFAGTLSGSGNSWTFNGTLQDGGNAIWTPKKGSAHAECNLTGDPSLPDSAAHLSCSATFDSSNFYEGKPWQPWKGQSDGTISSSVGGDQLTLSFRGRGNGTGAYGEPAGIDHLDVSGTFKAPPVQPTAQPTAPPAQPTTAPQLVATPTPVPDAEPHYQITAYLDCGNYLEVEVGPPGSPAQSQTCDLVIDGFRGNTSYQVSVLARGPTGSALTSGLIPGTGVVVFPGDFAMDPANMSRPYYAPLLISACTQPIACPMTMAPGGPVDILFGVSQEGAGEYWVTLTVNRLAAIPFPTGPCPAVRRASLDFVDRLSDNSVHLQLTVTTGGPTTSLTYARLERTDANQNSLGVPFWESYPDPNDQGGLPFSQRQLLLVQDPGTGQILNPPWGQEATGWWMSAAVPGPVPPQAPTVLDLFAGPDESLAPGQPVRATVYFGNNLSSCQLSAATVLR